MGVIYIDYIFIHTYIHTHIYKGHMYSTHKILGFVVGLWVFLKKSVPTTLCHLITERHVDEMLLSH
jgi:hypothetical protein